MSSMPGMESADMALLYGPFRLRVERVLHGLVGRGLDPRVRATFRDEERQKYYVRSGWSRVDWSFHMARNDDGSPGALAADIVPAGWIRPVSGKESLFPDVWEEGPWQSEEYGRIKLAYFAAVLLELAEKWELTTGARWSKTGTLGDLGFGWDFTHMQPANLRMSDARRGVRPW